MKVKLMLLFSVLVFYKLSVIIQYFTQLETKSKYTFQSDGIQNSTLKYILYWNEAYKNKGEEKYKKKTNFKNVSKIMDSVAELNLLGFTNVRSVTVFLPITG